MITIVDYDAGNIKSVEKALQYIGAQCVITRDTDLIGRADKVIVPGVGAFEQAMDNMRQYQLIDVLREVAKRGTPILGICLGLQLFFEGSEENDGVEGLGLLRGRIVRFHEEHGLKIPHIGWNSLSLKNKGRLFEGMEEEPYVYFVHSYYLKAEEEGIVKAVTEYGVQIHASVEQDNLFACQFHPEKSSRTGLKILKNFVKLEV